MDLSAFKNKKIAILGYGTEGRSTYNFFKREGFLPAVLDKKPKEEHNLPQETEVVGGEEYLTRLEEYDVVVRSPGIPISTPELITAEKAGVVITSQIKIFFDICPCPIIGVTGTKGKGTTSALIYEILKAEGKHVFLGGNIGVVPLDFMDKIDKNSVVVLELSSFQLQDLHKSPAVAVVLPITSDHLNHHKNVQEYVEAKSSIAKFQSKAGQVVYNSDNKAASKVAEASKGKKLAFSITKKNSNAGYLSEDKLWISIGDKTVLVGEMGKLQLRGQHNAGNILAASLACYSMDVKIETIRTSIKSFKGLPYRLEKIGEIRGVTYVNDSYSTLPDATIAAIKAFKGPLILIAGGSEKHANYEELAETIASSSVKVLITIGTTGPRIEKSVKNAGFKGKIESAGNDLQKAVVLASKAAKTGDTVLFSPASASFDMFANAKERGDVFFRAVKMLNE